MQIIKATFNDFDLYNESIRNWDLDFRLLSKNDFKAYVNMFSSQTFQLARTRLSGKIEQFGLTPVGFRSIVIPVNYHDQYIWLNKKVNGSQLLIFPKKGVLDAISFENFDVYIVSIEESLLSQMIDSFGYNHAKKLFNGDEQHLFLSQSFAIIFHQLATGFLELMKKSKSGNLNNKFTKQGVAIDNLLTNLLRYIENSNQIAGHSPQRKRDVALKNAVDLINNQPDVMPTVAQLCNVTNVSERTLEYAFLEKYQVTPKEYIQANRLNKVKKELFLSKELNTSISTLAAEHGFWHMGQFAADFKKQFGELPSEFLNR